MFDLSTTAFPEEKEDELPDVPMLQLEERRVGRFKITNIKRSDKRVADVEKDSPPVVAVLFGWLGARDRNLAKYAQLYHRLGMPVVLRTTTPVLHNFDITHTGLKYVVKHLLDILSKHFPTSKVVIQYFSNGGCFVHWHLVNLLNSGKRSMPNLVATIFDSCPAGAGAVTASRALAAGQRNPYVRVLLGVSVRVTLTLWDVVSLWSFERAYKKAIESDALPVPSLYIYSQDDHITDYKLVEEVIQARRALKQKVGAAGELETWFISSSPHVLHYLHHGEEYTARLDDFLVKVGALGGA